MRRPSTRLLPAVLLMLLLCVPGVLWVAGVRQPLLESRPKEEFPALNRSSLRDEHTFRRIDTALLDRLPVREQALDLHARLALDLFHDSSNPDVAIGDDGYLYYVPELASCSPGGEPLTDPADTVDVLARTLVAAGLRTTTLVTGGKLFTHSDDAPSIDAERERCAEGIERAMSQRLAQTPGGLSIDEQLDALEADGDPTFLRRDTHWNWRGREVFLRAILDRIRPGLAAAAGLRVGRDVQRPGDLDAMLGRERDEDDRAVEVTRTPRRPLPAGEVVLIGDSQMDSALFAPRGGVDPLNGLALPGQIYCNWSALVNGGCDDPLRRAGTVVVQKVARDARFLTEVCWRPVSIAAERIGRGEPAAWERVDGDAAPADGTLTLPDTGSATVRVLASPERADVPRLVRIPVERLPAGADGAPVPVQMIQQPQAGPAAPCATPAQAIVGGALLLPVPRDRRVADLVVRLQGAPGTRLGRPQTIELDGRQHPLAPARRAGR